jgi:glycine/D-amino acid oxidase-like deaminating enzyme
VQPARLVAGLARVVVGLGVEIFEGTRVSSITPGCVWTDRGVVEARVVVRATEGFTARLAGQRRTWLPMNSSMIVTSPLPERVWRDVGWAGREVLGDAATPTSTRSAPPTTASPSVVAACRTGSAPATTLTARPAAPGSPRRTSPVARSPTSSSTARPS